MAEKELGSVYNLVGRLTAFTTGKMRAILNAKGKSQTRIFSKCNFTVKEDQADIIITSNLPDYAKWVDEGRRPGKQPPLKTIQDWCKRKGINEKAAFPIARNIGKHGIPATNFLDPMRNLASIIAKSTGPLVAKDIMDMIVEMKKQHKNIN